MKTPRMFRLPGSCQFVLSFAGLCWVALSLLSWILVLASLVTPHWLIGPEPGSVQQWDADSTRPSSLLHSPRLSLGLFNRCQLLPGSRHGCESYVRTLPFGSLPAMWKVALGIVIASTIMLFGAGLGAFMTLYIRTLFERNIFFGVGVLQGIAGFALLSGILLFPLGWEADPVQQTCGVTSAFILGNCTLGWAFYGCVAGTSIALVAACLAGVAEEAVSHRLSGQLHTNTHLGWFS